MNGDSLEDRIILIRLALLDRWGHHFIQDSGEAKRLHFRSAHQDFSAEVGGAELLFLRRHLETRSFEELEEGIVRASTAKACDGGRFTSTAGLA